MEGDLSAGLNMIDRVLCCLIARYSVVGSVVMIVSVVGDLDERHNIRTRVITELISVWTGMIYVMGDPFS